MPRLVLKPNGNPLPNKQSHKRRHTLGHIEPAVASPRLTLLNELLSSLMVPFRMTDGGDQEAPPEDRRLDDDYRAHHMQRPPHAVSYDEDALRDRSEESAASHVDGASGTPGETVPVRRGEERSSFTGDSYRQSQDRHGQHDRDRNYSSSKSRMPIQGMSSAAAPAADGSVAAATRENPQFEQGTPRHPNYPRSHQESLNTPGNPFPYPPQHHYRFPPQQQQQYPYDYSGYYHPPSSEGDVAGVSPYHHHHVWPSEQPHGFQNYSSPYQDYSYHSYYSSSSPASYPPQHPPPRYAQRYPDDPYSSFNQAPSRSRHPHSAPPSYHRSTAYATSLQTTSPLPSTRESKHPTAQHYKETPSAVTEGTTPSKQSPPLELSPEMSALFDESGSEHEEDRKPAANKNADSQSRMYESRQEHGESTYMGGVNDPSSPRNDDFEPIPFWSDMPRDAVSSSDLSRYRIYPPVASVHPEEHSPPNYAMDPQPHGLAPQHRYPSTPTRSAAVAAATAVSSRQDSMASTLSSGGEGNSWEKRFAELLEFRAKFGHCEVPQNYKDNTSLGIWVNKQRMEQKNRMEGKNSSLNDSRMQRLESVGFRWAKRKGQVSWNEKFEELKVYKKKHGNCHVPTKYKANTALGRWVSTQRAEYKKFCEGDEKSSMTTEKIQRLEEIGFAWFMAL